MHPDEAEERLLDQQIDDIFEGLREGIDREVERLQREGLRIYVSDNGQIVDLQTNKPPTYGEPTLPQAGVPQSEHRAAPLDSPRNP